MTIDEAVARLEQIAWTCQPFPTERRLQFHAVIEEIVEEERKACADECERIGDSFTAGDPAAPGAYDCETAIRGRSSGPQD